MKDRKFQLPSKRSIEEAIKVLDDFRAVCRHQLDLGYWATTDFPSKHHINKLLQLQYIPKEDVINFYGPGLSARVSNTINICKFYISFLREENDKLENKKQGTNS